MHKRSFCYLILAIGFIWSPELIAQQSAKKMIRVVTRRDGELTRFFVENLEPTEITATFQVDTVNLKGSVKFPFTATFPAGKTTEAFYMSPLRAGEHWSYNYVNYFIVGSFNAVHDNAYIYSLPFAPGSSFKVSQGYHGSYSHSGSDEFAIDFKMPVGTPIHAARDGMVVKIKDDSDRGGPDRKYENDANYVLIRHEDGTVGNYAHLAKGGCKVKVGDIVRAGEMIAVSGNSGFSSGPHLHFSVFKAKSGKERLSIPVKFRNSEGDVITLAEGKTYRPFSSDHGSTFVATTSPKDEKKAPRAVGRSAN